MSVDLCLSSGYLAFARHIGFLRAVEASGLVVDGICGTSSGALIGALWAAGRSTDALLDEVRRRSPLGWTRPCLRPWRGALTLAPLLARLRQQLPPRFEDLPRPLAVGVVDAQGQHRLLHAGPLPEAVAASCAIPWLFSPVEVAGARYRDGGVADRLGLQAWRALRGPRPLLLHVVERSHGPAHGALPAGVQVVRSPRSGASLWSLGPVAAQVETTARDALAQLQRSVAC